MLYSIQQTISLTAETTNDVSILRPNLADKHQNENNELHHFHPQAEPSSRKLIFDTRDLL
jgi:hypothetical protein